ncbi:MAG: phosphoadenosine phosphosulfate reductase [Desertifilum sp.]|nr:phosphoadenosine phosphosulfate reductase [Desertifilum sp.]
MFSLNLTETMRSRGADYLLTVSLGLGVDSTALLIGLRNRGIVPDLINFANTGGEKPDTYKYLLILQKWCRENGFPKIKTVMRKPLKSEDVRPGSRKSGYAHPTAGYKTLEEQCHVFHDLPALAYGRKTCSQKWKREPIQAYQKQWVKKFPGDPIMVATLGIEYGEERRIKNADKGYLNWYPLIEWKWDRLECIKAIAAAGLPIPPKSSCFFCPAMRKEEIVALAENYPELLERALAIEDGAKPYLRNSVAGLGRRLNWRDYLESRSASIPGFDETYLEEEITACDCYDGGGTNKLYNGVVV